MTESAIVDLVAKFTEALEALDIQVIDATPFVYELNGVTYSNMEELRKAIVAGKASVFFNVEALLGESTFAFLDDEEV